MGAHRDLKLIDMSLRAVSERLRKAEEQEDWSAVSVYSERQDELLDERVAASAAHVDA